MILCLGEVNPKLTVGFTFPRYVSNVLNNLNCVVMNNAEIHEEIVPLFGWAATHPLYFV